MNPKSLGNSYEREIAKKISNWLTGSDEELVCWRQVNSGTVSTVMNKRGKDGSRISGDFVCLDSKYSSFFNLFSPDSKNLSQVHLCLTNQNNMKSSQLFSEYRKVCEDAEKNNKLPMMFVKARNDRKIPDFIMFPICVNFKCDNAVSYYIAFEGKKYMFFIVLQDNFFKCNKWEEFTNENLIFT